jgi:hypothetical protein
MYFLLGNCKFGGSACVYSHDKTYLSSGRWWEDDGKRDLLRHISESLDRNTSSAFMPYTFAFIDDRLAWASAHGVEMEEVYGHGRSLAELGFQAAVRNAADLLIYKEVSKCGRGPSRRGRGKGKGRGGRRGRRVDEFDEFDSAEEEKMAMDNFGFDEDDVMELAMQGVRPWDEDAWVSNLVSATLLISDFHMIRASGCSSCAPLALKASRISNNRHVGLMQAFMAVGYR